MDAYQTLNINFIQYNHDNSDLITVVCRERSAVDDIINSLCMEGEGGIPRITTYWVMWKSQAADHIHS